MNKLKLFLILTVITLLFSCNNNNRIEGLWIVKLVKVGDQEMTPNARWIRFNADLTQQSGNGWFQHSFGTWKISKETNKLSIKDSNGLKDKYGSYDIRFENNLMYWNRLEEGQKVEVTLERTDRLPETYGDRLLGLWKLEKAVGDGKYFKQSNNQKTARYLFLRWDRRFVIGSEQGRINGVYNVNGHKPELELIPYGEDLTRSFWKVDFGRNSIKLKLINSDSLVVRNFIRVNEFPK